MWTKSVYGVHIEVIQTKWACNTGILWNAKRTITCPM